LTATSIHPENAGVQLPLMELLLRHGARLETADGDSAVNNCLANGRGKAAEFLASQGARLDLEGAAGVGRLDAVKSFFTEAGALKPPATQQQMRDGFAWACEFGRTGVVDFLLQRGMQIDARLKHHGGTGLHWAAYGGNADTAGLLIARGSPVDARDDAYAATPLEWALHAWGNQDWRNGAAEAASLEGYYAVAALLVNAGASLHPQFLADVEKPWPSAAKARSDPRMRAALSGAIRAD
jgi:hypothetical protein